MPRFFTTDISNGKARITGDDAKHIAKSLRMRAGGELTVCDLNGSDYRCVIEDVSAGMVVVGILEKSACLSEPAVGLSLYQALPKADKLEMIAQKAVELGVSEITPVLTSRCVSRWDARDGERKLERLRRIALEAAKQSGRGMIPEIKPLCGFEAAIGGMKAASRAILFYENAKTPLREILAPPLATIAVMAGSEGGFSPEEAEYAGENGVFLASLGPRILRCETAALCGLSAINFALGEF